MNTRTVLTGFKAEFFVLSEPVSTIGEVDFAQSAAEIETLDTVSFTVASGTEPFWEGGADDNFAARISGDLHIETAGTYTFYLTSDDGSSLSIDGSLIIDNDGLHAAREQVVTLDLAAGAVAPLELLYFEKGGRQVLTLEWSGPDTAGERVLIGPESVSHSDPVIDPVDDPVIDPKNLGFKAEFFVLSEPVSTIGEVDFAQSAAEIETLDTVSFTVASGTEPFWEGGADDNFAARISGDLHIETAGTYTFYLTSDDGSSLSIDGSLIIDNDGLHAAREQVVTLDLAAGAVAPLELLYFEKGGRQVLTLEWSGPDTAGERVLIGPESVSHSDPVIDPVDDPVIDPKNLGFKAEFFVLSEPVSTIGEVDFAQSAAEIETLDTVSFTVASGTEPFWEGGADDNFAARISGDLHIETAGTYTFYLTSDDGSSLSIDGSLIIDNDGLHAAREQVVTLDLAAGAVAPLELLYFEKGGRQVLTLEWSGPDTAGERVLIGPESVSHSDPVIDPVIDPKLPQTPGEIADFVAAVRASPETYMHGDNPSKMGEHMATMNLVSRADATHIAIGHGDWDDPSNWHNGEVPGDDAAVLIPDGVRITYDNVNDARLFTLRVDGALNFATDANSQLIIDTIIVSPSGKLTIGTDDNPIDPNVNIDIIIANNGIIDVDWDPMLLSRGFISHGEVSIHGTEKDSHEKVSDDPMVGDTWVDFDVIPDGWSVGDTIVIAGTRYDGYKWDNDIRAVRHYEAEDEIRVITQIVDGQVFFNEPLLHNHDTPRDDLKTSVANYTRNVSFETENAETAEIYERGHIMFMHSENVDVRYAEFHELGRTDKSETALNTSEFDSIEFDTNVKGRYSFHLHRTGTEDIDNPAIAIGNAVYGSPGWGFVHHDSNAVLDNNATFNTFGAGYVAESGNETGAWTDNIAIFAQGNSWEAPKNGNDTANFDLGQTGDGFWFQGRMVEASDNIAASVNTGFVYFHRGGTGEMKNITFDADSFVFSDALYNSDSVTSGEVPVLGFRNNEVFAAKEGLHVVKADPEQGHDIHSFFTDFTGWSVNSGAHFEYTGHYTINEFDLTGKEPTAFSGPTNGISFGTNTTDMTIVDPTISGFKTGIQLTKAVTSGNPVGQHDYTVVNANITNVNELYGQYDAAQDTIIASNDLPYMQPDIILDGQLKLVSSADWSLRGVSINGTKTDSLGETEFANEWENFQLRTDDVERLLETDGYYQTPDGENYFVLDLFFSDRLSGDIYLEKHPVFIGDEIQLGNQYFLYKDAVYNGIHDLDDPANELTFDSAQLWATLSEGDLIFL